MLLLWTRDKDFGTLVQSRNAGKLLLYVEDLRDNYRVRYIQQKLL